MGVKFLILLNIFKGLEPEDRITMLQRLDNHYCIHCGWPQHTGLREGQKCQCWNDE